MNLRYKHIFLFLFTLLLDSSIFSQELNCNIEIEARQTGNENLQIFKTLKSQLTDFIYTPMSIDINVSFLAAGKPGQLDCESKIIKLGKSIGFASAELHQEGEMIATASSSLKLVKIEGSQKDFLKDNIAKDAKIIKA